MSLLTLQDVNKSYGQHQVIKNISFQLGEARCIALLGANGAGKTTILNMITGLSKPASGTITLHGEAGDMRKSIGYLPQYPHFFDWMTGMEFLQFAGELAGLERKGVKSRAAQVLEIVGLQDAKNRRIGKYSGGMKQRLGIAQAIIHKPKLLLLDEPVSALDPIGRREVLGLFQLLKQETTILFSTHILHDAEEVSDDILFIHAGELVEAGSISQLRSRYENRSIEIIFSEDANMYAEQLKAVIPFIRIEVNKNSVRLYAEHLNEAKELILREIVEKKMPVVKFEMTQTNLEEMFMKVAVNR